MFVKPLLKVFFFAACAACVSGAISSLSFEEQIVGGIPINITQAPWQISLQFDRSHICGGLIIAENEASFAKWILTAGHCAFALKRKNITLVGIRAGSSFYQEGGALYPVKRVITNPRFRILGQDYDYALLQLKKPIQLDETKQAIKLHDFDETFVENQLCSVSGWGYTQNSSEPRNQLRRAEVLIVNQQKCAKDYRNINTITPRMICAGYEEQGGKDACKGDSGGGLVATSTVDGKPRLIGIVSFGLDCAKPHYPGVYSRVLAAREWILTITGI